MSNPNVTIDRHKYIGGSDLPTILGLNAKYGTSIFEFAKEKAGIIPNKFKGNEFTKYGQIMEPVIRDYINAIYGANYLEDTTIDEKNHYRGNTDGIDRDTDIPMLEIKTFGNELDVDYYTPQCQFYMEKFNQPAIRLVGYKRPEDFYSGIDYNIEHDDSYFNYEFDENRIVEHIIKRDTAMWNMIDERCKAFQKAVNKLKENPNMSEDEFNKIFYGRDVIIISNKVSKLEARLLKFKELEKNYKEAKETLYKIFDERGIKSFKNGTMTITKVEPTSYSTETIDTKKLKEENPKIYKEYKITKTTNKKGYILITYKKDGD